MNQTEDQEGPVLVDPIKTVILKDLVQENPKTIQVLEGLSHLMLIVILDLGEVEENNIC
jgi:hypothetical protein